MIDITQLNDIEQRLLIWLLNHSDRPVPITTIENLPFQDRTFVENLLKHFLDTFDYEDAKGRPTGNDDPNDDWLGEVYRMNGMTSSFSINNKTIKLIRVILDKWT